MHRPIVYPASIPLETDILNTARHSMVGLGLLALDILGSSTVVNGFACTATGPASLNVNVAAGRIYSLQNVDNNAYSSLAADTAHQIVKQGNMPDSVALGCVAPTTAGFSINYLIQCAYQDQDTDNIALPYYNSGNPSVPFSGPGNTGAAQATTRKGVAAVTVKAGTAATTGTQTTPAPDTGNVGLWVVTVANGQSTITSANISLAPNAPFLSGTFTANFSGFSGSVTTQAQWWRVGPVVHFVMTGPISGTSNSNSFGISNMPSAILPSTTQYVGLTPAPFRDNGISQFQHDVSAQISSSGLSFVLDASSIVWTASGTKGCTNTLSFFWVLV